jgi:hypothetical protein
MERVVALAMAVVCIVLLPIVGLIFHMVHRVKPGALQAKRYVLKFLSVSSMDVTDSL